MAGIAMSRLAAASSRIPAVSIPPISQPRSGRVAPTSARTVSLGDALLFIATMTQLPPDGTHVNAWVPVPLVLAAQIDLVSGATGTDVPRWASWVVVPPTLVSVLYLTPLR